MKKSFLMIAAALFILAGCQKEESVNESTSNNVIHIGVKQIAPLTKVAAVDIAANKLSFKWEEGDQVAFDDNERIIIYTCTDPATGEFSGEALDPDATYWVAYPNGYSGTFIYRGNQIPKGHLIMNEEVSGSATTFTLDTHETIIHFKLKGAAKVGSIALSNGDADDDNTLSCGDGVQLSDTATDFYMDAMSVDPHKLSSFAYTLHIYDTNNKELKSVSFYLKEENQGTMVDFDTPIEVNAAPSIPEGPLPGVFSVSATKKVHFSKGNLYAKDEGTGDNKDWKWHFYNEQYQYNSNSTSQSRSIADSEKEIDLFTWGYDNTSENTSYSLNPKNTTGITGHDTEGNKQLNPSTGGDDWGVAYCGSNGIDVGTWRTLSTAEWQYLFSYDGSGSGGQNYDNDIRRGKYKTGVTVCSKANCVVLLPDNWDETVISLTDFAAQNTYDENSTPKWSKMQAAGAVCLPAAGYRNGSDVSNVGDLGYYWSATAPVSDFAYRVTFNSFYVAPGGSVYRNFCCSVRLVTDASVTPAPTPTTTGTAKATIGGSQVDVNWVQLWENGPKFAEYNVGAENSKAEDYGGYYNWGMSDVQTSSNCEDYKSGESPLTGDDDTATKLWGSKWRMPTQTELQGLIDNCDVAWTTVNDKTGRKFTGKGAYASNSVFLPAAGEYNAGDVYGQGDFGSYWSSTPGGGDVAYNLGFNFVSQNVEDDARQNGYSVRAVLAEQD